MNARLTRSLVTVALVMSVAELISAVIIWREAYADAQPWFAVVFALLFLAGAALVRGGRATAGAVVAGLLFLFELVTAPTWQRFSALDWVSQLLAVAVSICGLVLAVAVVVMHRRARPERPRTVPSERADR